jgi:hypothetical protein
MRSLLLLNKHFSEVEMVEPAVSICENLCIETAAHDAGPPALRIAFFGFRGARSIYICRWWEQVLFGRYAANPGRRRVTITSVGGFAVATPPSRAAKVDPIIALRRTEGA